MPEFVLERNYVLRTPNGVVSFVKGEPSWVTPQMEKDAANIGAKRLDGFETNLLETEKDTVKIPTGEDRTSQLFAAFELLQERNDSKEFTGQGIPTVKAMEKLLGFELDRKELAEAWCEFKIGAT